MELRVGEIKNTNESIMAWINNRSQRQPVLVWATPELKAYLADAGMSFIDGDAPPEP